MATRKAVKPPTVRPLTRARQAASARMPATTTMVIVSMLGVANALALELRITKPWRRSTTSRTRPSSSASRFSIFTILTPSRPSMTAVESLAVSCMAPRVALRVRLEKTRMTRITIGAPTKAAAAMVGSFQNITASMATTVRPSRT